VHFVTFGEQQLGQIGAVLAGNSRDKGFFHERVARGMFLPQASRGWAGA
jgi:hypothetical protein